MIAQIANDHTILAVRSFKRYIAIDDIVQNSVQGTPERITIPTTSSRIELDAITWYEGYKRLWLGANDVVHEKFSKCTRFPTFKPGSRKEGAVNKRRNAPGYLAPVTHLSPLP
jgi:hypothetical protein